MAAQGPARGTAPVARAGGGRLPDAGVARIAARGRAAGGRVTPGDIDAEIPLSSLEPADVADLVDRLESSGIEVEIDPALLGGRGGGAPPARGPGAGPPDAAEPAAARPPGRGPSPEVRVVADAAGPAGVPAAVAHPERRVSPDALVLGSLGAAVLLLLVLVA
jgi:hypothetical protein